MKHLKQRLVWIVLLCNAFIVLCIEDWHNLIYLKNTIKELREILKENSKYIEDGDYHLVKKRKRRKK